MLDWQKHKTLILRILKEIYSKESISSLLVFKGGTAAHLFYGLPRYSVDLDFDLSDREKIEEVYSEVKKIISPLGEVKQKEKKKNTIFFLLSYGEFEHNIKIEISRRGSEGKAEVLSYLGIPMKVMAREDMFAYKLIALETRRKTANRDIFDVHYFFSNNWPLNREIVEKKTGKKMPDFLDDCLKILKKIDSGQVVQGLGQLVDNKQKDWIKKNLLEDTIFLINIYKEFTKKGEAREEE